MSKEEENHLYNLSLVPAGIIVVIFWASFVYLMHNNELKTIWDMMLFIVPFWTLIIGTIFLTFELLYSRKTRTSFKSNTKRLVGRISLLVISMLSFLALFRILYPMLTPLIGDYVILYSGVIWSIVFFGVLRTFRHTINRFIEGQW